MLRNSIRRHCLNRNQRNDRPPCRVSYGLENISFHNFEQEYATKRLRMSNATERFRKFSRSILEEILSSGYQPTADDRHWKQDRRKDNVIPNGNILPRHNRLRDAHGQQQNADE